MISEEVKIEHNLNNLFLQGLGEVFNKLYLNKINNIINAEVKIEETESPKRFIAYTEENKIVINLTYFNKRSQEEQINTLLHEFFHWMQMKKKFIFFKHFKELDKICKKLYDIINSNLKTNIQDFFGGDDLPTVSYQEVIPYLLTGNMHWNAVKPETKQQIIEELKKSNLFNLGSKFWQKRLT